jgi:hypothetical protein
MEKIPKSEHWLSKNPKAYELVQRGLDQSEQRKIKKLNKDFSKIVDKKV